MRDSRPGRAPSTTLLPPARFGARASLVTASIWLVIVTVIATAVAPAEWRLRVLVIGVLTLLPGALAIRPSAVTAWIAATCWVIPGVLGFVLNGLGAVWLVAAACAFTGGVTESHRRHHVAPGAAP